MARTKSSRKARARGKGARRAKRQPSRPTLAVRERERIAEYLWDLVRALEQAMSTVIVSVEALRHQNADADEDVARVLQRAVGDRLYGEIEKLRELLAALDKGSQARRRREDRRASRLLHSL